MDKADFTERSGAPFSRPNRLAVYNESISDGGTGVIWAKTEAILCTHITNWDTFEAVEREARSFIVDAFDKAWYSELCKPVTFYARVMMRHMLEHLQVIWVINHAIYILDLQEKIRVMHTENESIAQYIWALEEAQQQAERASMLIMDSTLVMIATKAMLATQRFPTKDEKCEELGRYVQTWGKWKEMYTKGEKQSRVKRQAACGQDHFGGAVLEARTVGAATPGKRGTPVIIDELEGCFDSLATASTTGETTLDELVNTNSALTSYLA